MRRVLPLILLAAAAPAGAPAAAQDDRVLAQLVIPQRVIVRVRRMTPVAPPVPVTWREVKGPKCVAAGLLAGAVVTARDRIDLVLRGGQRVRATLDDDCRGLDFYSGFYLRPDANGQVCAGRDAIRSRSGARCEIGRFRSLQAVSPR